MKTSNLALLAGIVIVGVVLINSRKAVAGTRTSASSAAAKYFGPMQSAFSAFTSEPNPVSDGTIVDNYLDLIFTQGGFYGGVLR